MRVGTLLVFVNQICKQYNIIYVYPTHYHRHSAVGFTVGIVKLQKRIILE